MNITLNFLLSIDACAAQRDAFAAAFPDGLTVTGEPDADVIARVVAAKLDVGWLCEQILTASADAAYDAAKAPAFAAYLKDTARARADYNAALAIALAAHRGATARALAAYNAATAPARAAYREATAPARAAYDAATATAVWRILSDDKNLKDEYRP